MKKITLLFTVIFCMAAVCQAKTMYFFDPETGAYTGSYREARINPEAPLTYLIDNRRATFIAPPELGLNEWAIFNKATGAWNKVSDYRGSIFYKIADGSRVEITRVNQEQPIDTVATPPDPSFIKPYYDMDAKAWKDKAIKIGGVAAVSKEKAEEAAQYALLQNKALLIIIDTLDALIQGKPAPVGWNTLKGVRDSLAVEIETIKDRGQ